MKISLPFRSRTLHAGIGAALLLATAALLPQRANTATRDPKIDAMNRVVVLLDGYVQTRFEEDSGLFGLSRMMPPINGHERLTYNMSAANEREREIIKAVKSAPVEYLVEFLHIEHLAGGRQDVRSLPRKASTEQPERRTVDGGNHLTLLAARSSAVHFEPYVFGKERAEFTRTVEERLHQSAVASLTKLKRGDTVDTTVGDWRVAFRPIRASKASCVNCHTGIRAGDTLGVMLYAVRPQAQDTARGQASAAQQR